MKKVRLRAFGALVVSSLVIGCNGIKGEPIHRHHQDSIHHQQVHDQVMEQHQRDHEQATQQQQHMHEQAVQQHNTIINNS